MPVIELLTTIHAPRSRVFDLARSVQVHEESTKKTHERAIGGVTEGLLNLNDEVTWQAVHFGFTQCLTVRILAFRRPDHFQDAMVNGIFERMVHDHHFYSGESGTLMKDRFEFESPFGFIGRLVNHLFLTDYLRRFLMNRNDILRGLSESDRWKKYLSSSS